MLEATIFGSFSLTNETAALKEEDIQANKLIQLLAYMICNRDTVVTKRRLSEQFWPGNSKNPENALKNLMYRLRNMLKILGPEEYICTRPAGYQWNPEIPVRTDYDRFEELGRKIKEQPDGPIRKELCKKAVASYRGDVSILLAYETWLQPRIIYYQTMYLDITKILCDIYERGGEWEELEKLCRKTVEHEPLDEDIQCWFIRSLQKQQKYDQALFQYENVKKQFYENLGTGVSKRFQEIFQEIVEDRGMQLTNIASIMQEAGEKERPQGAFFCDYQIFRQIYRLEIRRISRIGISEYILLLTVRRTGNLWDGVVVDAGLIEGVSILEGVVRNMLRAGDVVARNGPAQYVILLSFCSCEEVISVAKRIRRNFLRRVKHLRIELKYELEELSYQWKKQEVMEEWAERQQFFQ